MQSGTDPPSPHFPQPANEVQFSQQNFQAPQYQQAAFQQQQPFMQQVPPQHYPPQQFPPPQQVSYPQNQQNNLPPQNHFPPQNFQRLPSNSSVNSSASQAFHAKTPYAEMKRLIQDQTSALAARNDILEKEIVTKNERIKELEFECDQGVMRQKLTAEMKECERLREENVLLRNSQSECDLLKEQMVALQEENANLRKAFKDLQQSADESSFSQELQIKEMEGKIEELLRYQQEQESQLDEAGSMVLNLESQIKDKDKLVITLKDEIATLKKGEVDALEAKIQALEEEISHLVAENEECVQKWKNIREKNEELEVFQNTMQDQQSHVDKKWEQKYGELLCSVEESKAELELEQSAHKEAKEQIASLQDKIRKMEVFNLDIMKAHDSDDLVAVVQKIQAQILVRDADLEAKVEELSDIKELMREKEASLNQLLDENSRLRKHIEREGCALPPDFDLHQMEDLQIDVVQENLALTKRLECEKEIVESLEIERHQLLEKLRERACDPTFEDVGENIRIEYMKLQEEIDKMKEHESRLEEDNKMLKFANETLRNTVAVDGMKELMETMMAQFQDQPTVAVSRTLENFHAQDTPSSVESPDVMNPTEDDKIFAGSSLGHHCAKELLDAENHIQSLTEALREYESKMQVLSGSIGQLYQEHNGILLEKTNEITQLKAEMERVQQINDELNGRLDKEATVDDLLNSSDEGIVQKMKEITNENFILTVNEKMLARRFKSIQHELEMRDDFTTQVQKDASEMEQVLKDRICVLENGLKLQRSHYEFLNDQFKDSVPKEKFVEVQNSCQLYKEEVDRLSVQISDLQVKAAKYCHTERKLRHQEDLVSQLTLKIDMFQMELTKKREMFEKVRKSGSGANPVPSLLGEIANLETQVEQLKQRDSRSKNLVTLAKSNLEKAENQIDDLTGRLSEMEQKFQTLSQEHIISETKLGKCVSVETSQDLESQLRKLQKQLAEAKNQASQFRELSQIASNQAKQLNSVIQSNSITLQVVTSASTPDEVALKFLHSGLEHDSQDVTSYDVPTQLKTVFMKLIDRAEFRDLIQAFEEKSQDELLIGKLHKSLQHVKSLEARNRTGCINARNEANSLQVKVMKLHQQIQGKEEKIIRLEKEHRLKELALKASIDALRREGTGLSAKEAALMRRTNEELMQTLLLEQDLAEKEKRGHSKALLMIRELQEVVQSYQRIDEALENFQEENLILAKIKEWNEKLQSKCLENARLEFQIEGYEDKIQFLSKRCDKFEAKVLQLKEKESIQCISQDKANEHLTKTFFNEMKRYKEFRTERNVTPLESEDSEDKAIEMESSMERLWAKQQEQLTRIESENQQLKEVLQERNETVTLLQKEYEHQIDEKHRMAIDERETILATAREQIASMREQLEMKTGLIKQYKNMIEGLNLKHRSALMTLQKEISRLNEIILNSQDIDMDQLQAAVDVIDGSPKLPQGLVTQEAVDEILEDRNLQMTVLVEENEHLQQLIEGLREQILIKTEEIEDLSASFEDVEKHSKETKMLTKKLRRDLQDKERRQKQLSKTILELKQQLLEVAEQHERRPATPPVRDHIDEDFEKRLEAQKTRSDKRVRTLKAKISKLESELDYEKSHNIDSVRKLLSKNVDLKSQLSKKETHNNRLHESNVKLTQDKRKLQEKHSKAIRSHRKENSKLKAQLKNDESADTSLNLSTHSASEQPSPPQKQKKNDEAFARWNETKKLRRTIDSLKKKLESRTQLSEQLRVKVSELEAELESLQTSKAEIEQLCEKYRVKSEKQFSIDEAYEIVKYNHQLNQAKEEVIKLQRVIYVDKESEIVNLKMKLEKSEKQCKDLEKVHVGEFKTPAEQNRYVEQVLDEKEALEKQLEDLEKGFLQANVKNLELQFEVDTHSTVQQQLRTRIELLEGTLDRLKQEEDKKRKTKLPKDEESMRKLILNLKELATRQKTEIENMKRNQVSNAKHMSVVKDNRLLKSKLKELEKCPVKVEEAEHMEAEITELKEEINRLTNINKQVRRNLTKEIDAAAKRKRKLEELEKEKILLEDQVEEKDRECEEKIKEMQTELYREKKMLEMDMKATLRKREIKSKEVKHLRSHNDKLKQELKSLLALTENQKEQLVASEDLRAKQREKIDQQLNQCAQFQKEAEVLRDSDNVQKVESLREENIALRAELSAFDSQFFDEIEDLKYREKQQRELNAELQEQLRFYQSQFNSV